MFYIVLLTVTSVVTPDLETFPSVSRPDIVISEDAPAVVTGQEEDGPFCTMYKNFFHEVYQKSTLALTNIFASTERAVDKLNKQSDFAWLGELEHFVQEVIKRQFQETPSEKIKVQAKLLHDRMKDRRNYYSADVNQVLDYMNDFFTENDTVRGNQAISDFRNYPRVDKTSLMICCEILEAFNEPFSGGIRDNTFSNILEFSNRILKKEYPHLFTSGEDYGNVKLRISLYIT